MSREPLCCRRNLAGRTAFRRRGAQRVVPLRCPSSLAAEALPRLAGGLRSPRALSWLREGRAFVTSGEALLGGASPLLQWDFDHLSAQLPPARKFGLYLVHERLVMSHSIRYNPVWASDGSSGSGCPAAGSEGACTQFKTSEVLFLPFREFVARGEHAWAQPAGFGVRPYLGLDLFRRTAKAEPSAAALAKPAEIGEALRRELSTFSFDVLDRMAADGELPPLMSMHLFVGGAATLYHMHYDLNPNLHIQLVGRKRFVICPPEEWNNLYPFPVHHDFDRRSQLDLDAPDAARHSRAHRAKGFLVELEPGDALYIPPLWWHHVQTLTTPCVSVACWLYDLQPTERDMMPSSAAAASLERLKAEQLPPVASRSRAAAGACIARAPPCVCNSFGGHFFGLSRGGAELSLLRWVEQVVGSQLIESGAAAGGAADTAAARAAKSGDTWGGPAKERAVAGWMRLLGRHAAGQRVTPAEQAVLPPLRVPLEVLVAELRVQLAADLGDASLVGPWLQRAVEGRFS